MARRSPARDEAAAREAEERARSGASTDHDDENEGHGDAGGDESGAPRNDAIDGVLARFLPENVRTWLNIAGEENNWKARLLAEVCLVFGIDPNPKKKPRELLSHRFEAGDPDAAPPIPANVTIVTAGGTKIRYPIDEDTEARLRVVFNAYVVDKASGEKKELPLPPDMTLPREYVDGLVKSREHQYRKGYLREGGKEAADRKERVDELRRAGVLGRG